MKIKTIKNKKPYNCKIINFKIIFFKIKLDNYPDN